MYFHSVSRHHFFIKQYISMNHFQIINELVGHDESVQRYGRDEERGEQQS